MTVYLYGLLRAPVGSDALSSPGVDGTSVALFEDGGLACIVSDLADGGFRPRRGDVLAHSDVLQEAISGSDVLPMRFGTVFESRDELANRFLRPNERELEQMLDRLQGSVEVQVKGEYEPDAIAGEIVSTDRTIQKLQARSKARGDVDSKIELGRRFAAVLEQTRYGDGRRILDALEPLANEVSIGSPLCEYGVVNASFLVPRSELERFDRGFVQLAEEAGGKMKLRLVGPLPPYSFVDAGSLVVG